MMLIATAKRSKLQLNSSKVRWAFETEANSVHKFGGLHLHIFLKLH